MPIYKSTAELEQAVGPTIQQSGGVFEAKGGQKFKLTGQGYEEITPAIAVPANPALPPVRQPRPEQESDYYKILSDQLNQRETQLETSKEAQRQTLQQQLEARLGQIETETARRIREQEEVGAKELAKARGINIRSGLQGSPFGEALRGEVESKTRKLTEEEKTLGESRKQEARGVLAQSLRQIEDNYQTRIASIGKERTDILEKRRTETLNNFEKIVASGQIGLNKAKESGLLDEIAVQMGESPEYVENIWALSQPVDKVVDKFREGNKYYVITQNPDGTYNRNAVDLGDLPAEYTNVQYLPESGQIIYYSKDPNVPPKIVGGLPQKEGEIYSDKNIPGKIRQSLIDTLSDKEGAKTLGRELTIKDLIGLFPEVDRETLQSYMDDYYDYESLISENEDSKNKPWYQFWK